MTQKGDHKQLVLYLPTTDPNHNHDLLHLANLLADLLDTTPSDITLSQTLPQAPISNNYNEIYLLYIYQPSPLPTALSNFLTTNANALASKTILPISILTQPRTPNLEQDLHTIIPNSRCAKPLFIKQKNIHNPDTLHNLAQWIALNRTSKNIKRY